MESIEKHIEEDKKILQDPTTNPQMRRHIEGELHDLEEYVEHHKKEIEAGDHHDPSYLELFCDQNPSEPECLIYDDYWSHLRYLTQVFLDQVLTGGSVRFLTILTGGIILSQQKVITQKVVMDGGIDIR